MIRLQYMGLGCVAALALASGCQQTFVKRVGHDRWTRTAHVSALTHNTVSPETAQFLRQANLDEVYAKSPDRAIASMIRELRRSRRREVAIAAAEMCYARAKQMRKMSPSATASYLSCAELAYAFLFDVQLQPAPSPYDKRFRNACEFYNHALSQWAANTRKRGNAWGDDVTVTTTLGPLRFDFGRNDLAWGTPFTTIEPAQAYEVKRIKNRMSHSGLGVPLIAIRKAPPKNERPKVEQFLPGTETQAFSATLFARFLGSVIDERTAPRRAVLESYDPLDANEITINDQIVPLETDTTTPFAYMLDRVEPPKPVKWLMNPEEIAERRGLYMLQPYKQGKIPVVFVHGLLSSPMTWLEMINDVLGADGIRDRYQVWFFLYPTGNPPLYSAYLLREALKDAKVTFDPEDTDPAFDDVVIVGHSMGGLITHINATDIGPKLWDSMFATDLDSAQLSPKTKQFFRDLFFVEPLPFVSRVIFIATPHRGSGLADKMISRMFASFVKMPHELQQAIAEADEEVINPKVAIPTQYGSISGLSQTNPILTSINEMNISTTVRYHSIIANSEIAAPGGTDTIVPYESAFIEGATSELNIKGTHTCTEHPLAIREVRRILLLHAAEFEAQHPVE